MKTTTDAEPRRPFGKPRTKPGDPPSPRQRDLLDALAGFASRGVSPTYRELAEKLGVSTTLVAQMVVALRRKGLLAPAGDRKFRSLKLAGRPDPEALAVEATPEGVRVTLPGRPLTREEARRLAWELARATREEG